MKKLATKLTIAAGLAAVMTACAASDAPQIEDNNAGKVMDLAGSEWGYESENAANENARYIQFQTDGKVIGFGGCNRFSGTYKQNGAAVEIGPLAATKMACPSLPKEASFITDLSNTQSVDAAHLKLVLRGENDRELLTLIRRDWD